MTHKTGHTGPPGIQSLRSCHIVLQHISAFSLVSAVTLISAVRSTSAVRLFGL